MDKNKLYKEMGVRIRDCRKKSTIIQRAIG